MWRRPCRASPYPHWCKTTKTDHHDHSKTTNRRPRTRRRHCMVKGKTAVRPGLSAENLIAAVPDLAGLADLSAETISKLTPPPRDPPATRRCRSFAAKNLRDDRRGTGPRQTRHDQRRQPAAVEGSRVAHAAAAGTGRSRTKRRGVRRVWLADLMHAWLFRSG